MIILYKLILHLFCIKKKIQKSEEQNYCLQWLNSAEVVDLVVKKMIV